VEPKLFDYKLYSETKTKVETLIKQIISLQSQLEKETKLLDVLTIFNEPKVSLYEFKNNSISYIKGSFQSVMPDGETFRASVYVGKLENFKQGKNDPKALKIAQQKISLMLKSKFLENK
jgi:hypothetical protein